MLGERLANLVSLEALKLAAGAVLLSPYIPMVFMGEEYAEDLPFQYFISHTDKELIEAVRKGRTEEFESFQWQGQCPDPQAVKTFTASKLNWEKRSKGRHKTLLNYYRELIALRKAFPNFTDKKGIAVRSLSKKQILLWHRRIGIRHIQCVMNFSKAEQKLRMYAPQKGWVKILDSADTKWAGPGSLLPSTLRGKRQVIMPALSVAVFNSKELFTEKQSSVSEAKTHQIESKVHAGANSYI
jgi:maltooligosyltrehalose trehalohydrolase